LRPHNPVEVFVNYLYSDPSDNFKIRPKLSYVMMVDQDWLIGSGIYEVQGDNPIIRVGGDPQVREGLKSIVEEAITYSKKMERMPRLGNSTI